VVGDFGQCVAVRMLTLVPSTYEVPGALARWPNGRGDSDQPVAITRHGACVRPTERVAPTPCLDLRCSSPVPLTAGPAPTTSSTDCRSPHDILQRHAAYQHPSTDLDSVAPGKNRITRWARIGERRYTDPRYGNEVQDTSRYAGSAG